jgi:NAD(P)-dependent dehydrogenase (short-subunit alcohol dehydrogenase family)
LDPDDLRAVFELNVIGPLMGMQAVLPIMRAGSGGAIVNVSSATSLRVFPGLGGYAATKAALNMLSQTAQREFAAAGVAVSVVYPRVTATEFHQRLRAGTLIGGARGMTPDPPERVGEAIILAIHSGEAHVLVADPPRPIVPGELAWQSPTAPPGPVAPDEDPSSRTGAPIDTTEPGHPR